MSANQIVIAMPPQTVEALIVNGYSLYAYQVVRGPAGGRPLPWARTSAIAQTVVLAWTEAYQAYVSRAHGPVSTIASYEIQPGQTLHVTSPGGSGEVKDGGVADAVGILNQTTEPLTAGIALEQDGSARPLCAFPLHGGNLVLVEPEKEVFLLFSALGGQSDAGQSLGPGVLVDLSDTTERMLTFDIDRGWSSEGAAWARPLPPLTDLGTLLIHSFWPGPQAMTAGVPPEPESADETLPAAEGVPG